MSSSSSSSMSSSSTMMGSSDMSKLMGGGGMGGMPSLLDKMGGGVDFEELSTAGNFFYSITVMTLFKDHCFWTVDYSGQCLWWPNFGYFTVI